MKNAIGLMAWLIVAFDAEGLGSPRYRLFHLTPEEVKLLQKEVEH